MPTHPESRLHIMLECCLKISLKVKHIVRACIIILPTAVDTLSDMVQNSTLDEKEIEKERGIILKDIQVSYCCFVVELKHGA